MAAGDTDGWDFFVSYTAADQEWAEWIAWQLEEADYQVLIQVWDFVPGAHWMSRMIDGVRASRRVLAVLSDDYLHSVYGRKEWQAAFQADPDGVTRKVIPIRIKDCARPNLLDTVVSFDLFGIGAEHARTRLLNSIRAALEGRAKPPTAPVFPGTLVPPSPATQHGTEPAPVFPGETDLKAPTAAEEEPHADAKTVDDRPPDGARRSVPTPPPTAETEHYLIQLTSPEDTTAAGDSSSPSRPRFWPWPRRRSLLAGVGIAVLAIATAGAILLAHTDGSGSPSVAHTTTPVQQGL